MGLFEDLHLLICIVAMVYLFGKVRDATKSRVLGVVISAFIVFFIFFQHMWIAFLFFFIMFGYMFFTSFTAGIMEGQMAGAYMHYLRNPQPGMPIGYLPPPSPASTVGSWWGKGAGGAQVR